MKNLITITLGLFLGMTSVSTAQIIKNKEAVKVKKINKVQHKPQHKPQDNVMLLKKRIDLISPLRTDKNVALDATLQWEVKLASNNAIINYKPPSPRYDVYFGTETNPTTKVSSGQIERSYKPTLEHNTTYYWRIVITGSTDEIDKSLVYSFKTAPFIYWDDDKFGTFTDPRDDKVYKVMKIGEQVWFAENLAYLPKITPYNPKKAGKVFMNDYYVYEFKGSSIEEAKSTYNYKTFGVLYDWTAAMNYKRSSDNNPSGVQGACPCGWHVPSISEWTVMITAVGNNGEVPHDIIGKALASNTIWDTSGGESDTVAYRITNNSTGFNALPSGWGEIHSDNEGGYLVHRDIGNWTMFWTTSSAKFDVNKHWSSFQINKWRGRVNINERYNSDALSIRCVKD